MFSEQCVGCTMNLMCMYAMLISFHLLKTAYIYYGHILKVF